LLNSSAPHRDLPSFPTRRSSDLGQMHTTSDFSYKNRTFIGQRLLRVGDAAGFMDPIFSAGVYLACYSAKLAAEVITQALEKESEDRKSTRLNSSHLGISYAVFCL